MEHAADIAQLVQARLAMLGRGFGTLTTVEGRQGVELSGTGEIAIPQWARGLMVRFVALDKPLFGRVAFHDAEWRSVAEEPLCGSDCLLGIELPRSPFLRVTLPAGLRVLLTDLDIYPHGLRARFDLAALRARGRRFLTLRLDLTNKCNLRCRMCQLSFDEVFFQPKDYVGLADFARVAEQILPYTGHVSLSAGFEPLLHPQFKELVALVRQHGVPYVDLTTNGTVLTQGAMEALVDAEVNCVIFSVDGARRETYEHIRRGADFGRFLRSLNIFRSIKRQRNSRRPGLAFNMVLMRRNVGELADVLRLGARFGLSRMNTALMVPHVGLGMEDELLQLDRERANAAFAEARAVAAELKIEAQIPPDFDMSLPEPSVERVPGFSGMTLAKEWEKGASQEIELEIPADGDAAHQEAEADSSALIPPDMEPMPSWFPTDIAGATMIRPGSAAQGHPPMDGDGSIADTACPYPWTMAVMRPDQAIVPCCQWVDAEIMGDLKTQSWDEIWNGPAYQRLRIELQTRRLRPTCLHCPERQRI
ncbi:MAG: radical SAM/SPASM domain-containing protein [Planctomycetes bacterium]|nr:radical SAM/SPASM domain-containing protein [Planctomycetota bacterium]